MSGRTTLEVENVGYEVNGRRILSDVTTRFEAGEVTAVMGPSGAGKSTLLAVLGGRAPGTMVSGTILANNVPIDQERMRTLLSHMPQEDIMHEELTIRKTLYYAAMLRSSGELTSQEKLERADHIMDLLGIRGVADSTVMAVSGGQRKRASAAIEFLSSRPILTFDEPTSGLDSALASALVQRLVVAARDDGRTVVCTIHQPAWKLVEKFHRLFVLAPVADRGGMVVFDAPPSALPGFLCSGTDSPASANVDNPADYLLYALQRDGPEAWRDNWNASRPSSSLKTDPSQGVMPKAAPPQTSPSPTQLLLKCDERICSASAVLDALFEYSHKKASNYPISPFEQYVILTFRTFDVFFSDSSQCRLMLKMLAVYVVVGVALVYGMPQNFSKLNALLNIFLAQYTLTMLPLVVIMPSERRVIMREVRNGAFGVAPYWCARCTLGITYAFFVATVMTCIYPLLQLSLNPIAAKLFHWFVTQWVYMSCVMLFALTVGMLTSSPIAGIKAVVAFMIP